MGIRGAAEERKCRGIEPGRRLYLRCIDANPVGLACSINTEGAVIVGVSVLMVVERDSQNGEKKPKEQ